MNKFRQCFLYIFVSAIALSLISGCTKDVNNDVVITINNSSVTVEEFKMLLNDNILQYEQTLRQELTIPDSQTVLEHLNNDKNNYKDLMLKKNIELCKKIKTQQNLGEKYKISNSFHWKSFNQNLKKENLMRLKKIENEEPIYGVKTFSQLQYYTYTFNNMVNKLIEVMSDDQLMITDDKILDYYNTLQQPSTASGEFRNITLCDITSLLDSSGEYMANENEILNLQAQLSNFTLF